MLLTWIHIDRGGIFLTLPQHSSYKLQFFDLLVFGHFLKVFYNAAVGTCMLRNLDITMPYTRFLNLPVNHIKH